MPVPQGWEWLDDLPDEWEAPPDLGVPTPYPEVNLAIRLLSCEFLGFEVRVAIGRFVSEEALYDMWFIENVETASWGMKKSALLREVPMEQARIVYEAWKRFEGVGELDAPSEDLRKKRMAASSELVATLERAAETFVRIREGGVCSCSPGEDLG
jgi:hypothetical protein